MDYEFSLDGLVHKIAVKNTDSDGGCEISLDDKTVALQVSHIQPNSLTIIIDNRTTTAYIAKSENKLYVHLKGRVIELMLADTKQKSYSKEGMEFGAKDEIVTPMPGKIVQILAKEGDTVKPKQPLVIVESMKMENEIKSAIDGIVLAVNFKPGDLVNPGQTIIKLSTLPDK
jgi:3-methylcrotonyl-CoA carboxylase alpha subunit